MARSMHKVKNLKEKAKFAKHSWEEFATKTQKKVIRNVVTKAEVRVNDLIQNLAQRVLDHVGEVRMNIYRESFEKIKTDLQAKVQENIPESILEKVLPTMKKKRVDVEKPAQTLEAEKAADELILKAQVSATKSRKKKVALRSTTKEKTKVKAKASTAVKKKKAAGTLSKV